MYYYEINRLIENGFAKKCESKPTGNRIWYLPHFGVSNVNKPGKVRLVFDAAAETSSVSLNKLLLSGPDLLKSLLGVLMRFTQFHYAIKADLRDMFLKIGLREADHDAQRFLWRGCDRSVEPDEYKMTSVLFGAKSSPCIALFIKNKNASLFSLKYPAATKSIIKNSYMDDFLESCETKEEASSRVQQVIEINKHANWEMHGWACNDASVLSNLHADSNDKQSINFEEKDSIEKILGLRLVNSSDELIFNINIDKIIQDLRTGVKKPTKREFLKIIMSIFDPLGFLTPFTVESKLIMQSVWSSKIGWDEMLQDTEFLQWKQWLCNLDRIKSCRIPRCYQLHNCQVKSAELHTFCDASSKAYASVAYWRFCLRDGSYHVALIMAKSRIAQMKELVTTIPRLELQAAVLAIRVANIVTKEHDFQISRRVFWSDSKTVLHWINKEPREFKIFVANRLAEISENSSASEWRWIPSSENPADDGTRIAPVVLNKESRWFLGPAFLKKPEES